MMRSFGRGLLLGGLLLGFSPVMAQARRPVRVPQHTKPATRPAPPAALVCDSVPPLNRQVVAFAKSKLGQKVGAGECWDLAAQALEGIGAKWNGAYVFGQAVNYRTACVYPGDIVQFEGVVLAYDQDGMRVEEQMSHHTAIVVEVKGPGDYVIADQNSGAAGKKVALAPLRLATVRKGQLTIYRPVK